MIWSFEKTFCHFSSTNNSNSTPLAAGVIPTGIFAASSITSGAVQMPTSGPTNANANAPGPPKDGKVSLMRIVSCE